MKGQLCKCCEYAKHYNKKKSNNDRADDSFNKVSWDFQHFSVLPAGRKMEARMHMAKEMQKLDFATLLVHRIAHIANY